MRRLVCSADPSQASPTAPLFELRPCTRGLRNLQVATGAEGATLFPW